MKPNISQELINQARAGNQEAFASLYESHLDPIYRYIFYRVRAQEDAEDLTQTVFVKAWKGLPNLKEGSVAFTSWLYTIARNTVVDYWKKKRDIRIDDEEFFGAIPDEGLNQEQKGVARDDIEKIKGYLHVLSVEQQEIITLRFYEDRTTDEIAQVMGKNASAVRALQYRALKRLRDQHRHHGQK